MIDLSKCIDVFDPLKLHQQVHICGCGALGSHVAEQLARMGVTNIHLWDDDIVEDHNIANQMFDATDIGYAKVTAVAKHIKAINPDAQVTEHNCRLVPNQRLKGYLFLCFDSIVPRQFITEAQLTNWDSCGIVDIRMGLFSGQFYVATPERYADLRKTMNFTDEEAAANETRTACNFTMSVSYTIKVITGLAVAQWFKMISGNVVPLSCIINLDDTECPVMFL